MLMGLEPFAGNLGTDEFVFLILLGKSCIMKKTGKLEIFEIFSVDSLCHREVGRAIEDSFCVSRMVILVVFTSTKYIKDVGFC